MLDVQQVRLRFIFVRALYPVSLFSKALVQRYTVHLRCRFTKNSPRRTVSTPAGVFCALLASASSISKGLRQKDCSERTGMSVVPRRSDVFASQKLASRSVHGCTLLDRLFQKAYGEHLFIRAATESRYREN